MTILFSNFGLLLIKIILRISWHLPVCSWDHCDIGWFQ